MASKDSKDTQQELMERSLTNVRALVDKIEAEEAAQRRSQKWVIVAIVGAVIALVAAVAVTVSRSAPSTKPIVTTPEKLPPIRPGPPSK